MQKYIGIILSLIGAVMLILPAVVSACSSFVDYNAYTIAAVVLVVAGIILHIVLHKVLPL